MQETPIKMNGMQASFRFPHSFGKGSIDESTTLTPLENEAT
jgi:hypothetical protein